jgi:hypothetical protein
MTDNELIASHLAAGLIARKKKSPGSDGAVKIFFEVLNALNRRKAKKPKALQRTEHIAMVATSADQVIPTPLLPKPN